MAENKKNWVLVRRLLTIALLILVTALVIWKAREIEWDKVAQSLRAYRGPTLLLAAAFTALSYVLYAGFELLGRTYTRHRMPRPQVVAIAFVSYAFNLNFGAWIGGIGFRYRLYSRNGLKAGLITKILGMSLATNWLGFLCLAGVVFLLRLVPLPREWGLGLGALQLIGFGLLCVAVVYLALSAYARRRSWTVRGTEIRLPPPQMALAQVCLSIANWLVIAAVLFVLLKQQVPFHMVLAVLLMASIAGVIAHIPAGLGVIEAVFFAFLGGQIAQSSLLAALLAYRAVYYLGPLLIALVVYVALEVRARRHRQPTVHPAA